METVQHRVAYQNVKKSKFKNYSKNFNLFLALKIFELWKLIALLVCVEEKTVLRVFFIEKYANKAKVILIDTLNDVEYI